MLLESIVAVLVVLVDQISKSLCSDWLRSLPNYTYEWIPGIFHLSYVENRGAAFGMLQNARVFFLIITVLTCALLLWYLIHERGKLHLMLRLSLALILGGAVGNFIDRAILGYVRDMFSAVIINFAVFNVADSAITVGAALLFLDLLFFKGRHLFDETEAEKKGDGPAEEEACDGDTAAQGNEGEGGEAPQPEAE